VGLERPPQPARKPFPCVQRFSFRDKPWSVWGTLLGALAYAFYGTVALGGVMALAMMLNLLLAALMGVRKS
jgi:hypothetical protein